MRQAVLVFVLASALRLGLAAMPTYAQDDTVGLNAVSNTIALGAEDPRAIAGRIINVFLASLGVIALGLIIYGGFLWMTAGGEQEKVDRAKRLLTQAVIGLAIILSSWAIASFVLSRLVAATTGKETGGAAEVQQGQIGSGGRVNTFRVTGISPSGDIATQRIVVRVNFSKAVDPATIPSNVVVREKEGSVVVNGTWQVTGKVAKFTPSDVCPGTTVKCFAAGTEYQVEVNSGVQTSGIPATALCTTSPCATAIFKAGTGVDDAGPVVRVTSPSDGASVNQAKALTIISRATDASGVIAMSHEVNGAEVDAQTQAKPTSAWGFTSPVDISGYAEGTELKLIAKATDIADLEATSRVVSVVVRPEHCFNKRQDADLGETGKDCGPTCGKCSDEICTANRECSSGVCESGKCVERPIIESFEPQSGAIGTFVTIRGRNFGTRGTVKFANDKTAEEPCAASWSDTEVIVKVPAGTETGAISLTNDVSTLSDDTQDDARGIKENFKVDPTQIRPGLCALGTSEGYPGDVLNLRGANFGTRDSGDEVAFAKGSIYYTAPVSSWGADVIAAKAPTAEAATYEIRIKKGEFASNPIPYTLKLPANVTVPKIGQVNPKSGPVGTFVTISGENFGRTEGYVDFYNPDDAANPAGTGEMNFPAACTGGAATWSETQVLVKIPTGLPVLADGKQYRVIVRRADNQKSANDARQVFQVTAGNPGPGICRIEPASGTPGTLVKIYGVRFGASGNVKFKSATASADAWSSSEISVKVPGSAKSGNVSVALGANVVSNEVFFDVKACPPGEQCATTVSSTKAQYYAWRFGVGEKEYAPNILARCGTEDENGTSLSPSPSPFVSQPAVLPTGARAICKNARVNVAFDRDLVPGSASGLKIFACKDDACAEYVSASPVAASGELKSVREIQYNNAGNWEPGTTYEVVLTKAIVSETVGTQRGAALKPDARFACGTAGKAVTNSVACFKFKATNTLCVGDKVTVTLNPKKAEDAYDATKTNPYLVAGSAAVTDSRACVNIIAPSDFTWSIATTQLPYAKLLVNEGLTNQSVASRSDVAPLLETESGKPVLVKAAQGALRGDAKLPIEFPRPYVVTEMPACMYACRDAAVGAVFNVAMDDGTVEMFLRECKDETCAEYVGGDIVPASLAKENSDKTFIAQGLSLESGKYYRVFIPNTVQSAAGKTPAASFTNVTLENDLGYHAWIFRTKTDEMSCAIASVGVNPQSAVAVRRSERVQYNAVPMSSPDECSADGQHLDPWKYDWNWTFEGRDGGAVIARYRNGLPDAFVGLIATGKLTASQNGPGRYTATIATGYNARCLPKGSDGKVGEIAKCGNGVVEPGEACEKAVYPNGCTDACLWKVSPECSAGITQVDFAKGIVCVPGVAGCDETTCHWKGNSGAECGNGSVQREYGEACDDGNKSNSDGCSSRCLWEGSSSSVALCGDTEIEGTEECEKPAAIQDTDEDALQAYQDNVWAWENLCNHTTCLSKGLRACSAGATQNCCGNGTVDPGESCDDGKAESGDGCSSRCLLEGSSSKYDEPSFCGDGRVGVGEDPRSEADASARSHADPRQIVQALLDAGNGIVNVKASPKSAPAVVGQGTFALQLGLGQQRCVFPNAAAGCEINGEKCASDVVNAKCEVTLPGARCVDRRLSDCAACRAAGGQCESDTPDLVVQCADGRPSSPAPLVSGKPRAGAEAAGITNVCLNAKVSGVFTIPMKTDSLKQGIKVYRCTEALDPDTEVKDLTVNGFCKTWSEITLSDTNRDFEGSAVSYGFSIKEQLKENGVYEVAVTNATQAKNGLPVQVIAASYGCQRNDPGLEESYACWRFKVGTENCAVSSVSVSPDEKTGALGSADFPLPYQAVLESDRCMALRTPSGSVFDWHAEKHCIFDNAACADGNGASCGPGSRRASCAAYNGQNTCIEQKIVDCLACSAAGGRCVDADEAQIIARVNDTEPNHEENESFIAARDGDGKVNVEYRTSATATTVLEDPNGAILRVTAEDLTSCSPATEKGENDAGVCANRPQAAFYSSASGACYGGNEAQIVPLQDGQTDYPRNSGVYLKFQDPTTQNTSLAMKESLLKMPGVLRVIKEGTCPARPTGFFGKVRMVAGRTGQWMKGVFGSSANAGVSNAWASPTNRFCDDADAVPGKVNILYEEQADETDGKQVKKAVGLEFIPEAAWEKQKWYRVEVKGFVESEAGVPLMPGSERKKFHFYASDKFAPVVGAEIRKDATRAGAEIMVTDPANQKAELSAHACGVGPTGQFVEVFPLPGVYAWEWGGTAGASQAGEQQSTIVLEKLSTLTTDKVSAPAAINGLPYAGTVASFNGANAVRKQMVMAANKEEDSITASWEKPMADNTLAVAVVSYKGPSSLSTTMTAPSGWVLIGSERKNQNVTVAMYYQKAKVTGAQTWKFSQKVKATMMLLEYAAEFPSSGNVLKGLSAASGQNSTIYLANAAYAGNLASNVLGDFGVAAIVADHGYASFTVPAGSSFREVAQMASESAQETELVGWSPEKLPADQKIAEKINVLVAQKSGKAVTPNRAEARPSKSGTMRGYVFAALTLSARTPEKTEFFAAASNAEIAEGAMGDAEVSLLDLGKTRYAKAAITFFPCAKPWPTADSYSTGLAPANGKLLPFMDRILSPNSIIKTTGYSFFYCRDAQSGELPNLAWVPVPNPPDAEFALAGARDVWSSSLFIDRPAAGVAAGIPSGDAIGVQVYKNDLHLTPREWYKEKIGKEAPAETTIAGYPAVVDGNTMYIGGVYAMQSMPNLWLGDPLYTNIYVISYTKARLKPIADQLAKNIRMNGHMMPSIEDANYCEVSGKILLQDGVPLPCTANIDCASANLTGAYCGSFNDKLKRDVKRIGDFRSISKLLSAAKNTDGSYPRLESGSFVRGYATSVWPSWQAALGDELGAKLPSDPLNALGACQPTCSTNAAVSCNPTATNNSCPIDANGRQGSCVVPDPDTCWNSENQTFTCPQQSRIYQYDGRKNGTAKIIMDFETSNMLGVQYSALSPSLGVCKDESFTKTIGGTTPARQTTIIEGVGTQFKQLLEVGDRIALSSAPTVYAIITAIQTDTTLTVDTPLGNGTALQAITFKRQARNVGAACTNVGGGDYACGAKDYSQTVDEEWENIGTTNAYNATTITSENLRPFDQTVVAGDIISLSSATSSYAKVMYVITNKQFTIDRPLGNGTAGQKIRLKRSAGTAQVNARYFSCAGVVALPTSVEDNAIPIRLFYSSRCMQLPGEIIGAGQNPVCGDGVVSGTEVCEVGSVGGLMSCSASGGGLGVRKTACKSDCSAYEGVGECIANRCGNGVVDRVCEGSRLSCSGTGTCADNTACRAEGLCSAISSRAGTRCVTDADCGGGAGTCASREICDDGANNGKYGFCSTDCQGTGPKCGDGVLSPGEECDLGAQNGVYGSGCTQLCKRGGERCGDGAVNGGEQCEGNTRESRTGQTCIPGAEYVALCNAASCTWQAPACKRIGECGDGVTDPSEECDDGNDSDKDSCTTQCRKNVCGDGMVNAGVEECDAGTANNGRECVAPYGGTCNYCDNACRFKTQSGGRCGDGVRQPANEMCDKNDYGKVCSHGIRARQSCTTNADCPGASCGLVVKIGTGSTESRSQDEYCDGSFCYTEEKVGTCIGSGTASINGISCSNANECAGGVCSVLPETSKRCTSGAFQIAGQPCMNNSQCGSGTCSNGSCSDNSVLKKIGQTCFIDSECGEGGSGKCSAGICNGGSKNGEWCAASSECGGGSCVFPKCNQTCSLACPSSFQNLVTPAIGFRVPAKCTDGHAANLGGTCVTDSDCGKGRAGVASVDADCTGGSVLGSTGAVCASVNNERICSGGVFGAQGANRRLACTSDNDCRTCVAAPFSTACKSGVENPDGKCAMCAPGTTINSSVQLGSYGNFEMAVCKLVGQKSICVGGDYGAKGEGIYRECRLSHDEDCREYPDHAWLVVPKCSALRNVKADIQIQSQGKSHVWVAFITDVSSSMTPKAVCANNNDCGNVFCASGSTTDCAQLTCSAGRCNASPSQVIDTAKYFAWEGAPWVTMDCDVDGVKNEITERDTNGDPKKMRINDPDDTRLNCATYNLFGKSDIGGSALEKIMKDRAEYTHVGLINISGKVNNGLLPRASVTDKNTVPNFVSAARGFALFGGDATTIPGGAVMEGNRFDAEVLTQSGKTPNTAFIGGQSWTSLLNEVTPVSDFGRSQYAAAIPRGSGTASGLAVARNILKDKVGKKVVVLLTDAQNGDLGDLKEFKEASALKEAGIDVYVASYGLTRQSWQLKAWSSDCLSSFTPSLSGTLAERQASVFGSEKCADRGFFYDANAQGVNLGSIYQDIFDRIANTEIRVKEGGAVANTILESGGTQMLLETAFMKCSEEKAQLIPFSVSMPSTGRTSVSAITAEYCPASP